MPEQSLIATIDLGDQPAGQIAFAGGGRWLVAGGLGEDGAGKVGVWDVRSGRRLGVRSAAPELAPVGALAVSPDGMLVATAGWPDSVVRLWKLPSLTRAGVLSLIPDPAPRLAWGGRLTETIVGGLSFSPDGRRLAAGGWDLSVKLWSVPSGPLKQIAKAHRENVDFVAFSDDGKSVISGGTGRIRLYSVPAGKLVKDVPLRGDPVWHHACSADRRRLISVGQRAGIRCWNVDTWDGWSNAVRWPAKAEAVALSPDGAVAAIAPANKRLQFWNAVTGEVVGSIGLRATASWLCFSPDGEMIAALSVGAGGSRVELRRASTGVQGGAPVRSKRGRRASAG